MKRQKGPFQFYLIKLITDYLNNFKTLNRSDWELIIFNYTDVAPAAVAINDSNFGIVAKIETGYLLQLDAAIQFCVKPTYVSIDSFLHFFRT